MLHHSGDKIFLVLEPSTHKRPSTSNFMTPWNELEQLAHAQLAKLVLGQVLFERQLMYGSQ